MQGVLQRGHGQSSVRHRGRGCRFRATQRAAHALQADGRESDRGATQRHGRRSQTGHCTSGPSPTPGSEDAAQAQTRGQEQGERQEPVSGDWTVRLDALRARVATRERAYRTSEFLHAGAYRWLLGWLYDSLTGLVLGIRSQIP
eukprot:585156-Pyramimonas_sp.AAC.1